MYCAIMPTNVRIDMIYLLSLCKFTKLSSICHHNLSKMLKYPIRIDRLINVTVKKQYQTGVRIAYKNINTVVNAIPGSKHLYLI